MSYVRFERASDCLVRRHHSVGVTLMPRIESVVVSAAARPSRGRTASCPSSPWPRGLRAPRAFAAAAPLFFPRGPARKPQRGFNVVFIFFFSREFYDPWSRLEASSPWLLALAARGHARDTPRSREPREPRERELATPRDQPRPAANGGGDIPRARQAGAGYLRDRLHDNVVSVEP